MEYLRADSLRAIDEEASALYEPPFTNLHAGGPDGLFAGKENVIEGIFEKLMEVQSGLVAKAG
jgi:type I restriction enzyme R subunit